MIPGSFLVALLVLMLAACAAVSVFFGWITCLIFQLAWDARVAAYDLIIAAVSGLGGLLVVAELSRHRHHVIGSGVGWMCFAAVSSVLLRHLARRANRVSP